MAIVYYAVFKIILKIDRPHHLPFILSGTLPWAFFAQSISESTESLVVNHSLISKIPVPIQIFPYVVTLTNFTTLTLSLPIIFLIAFASGVTPNIGNFSFFYFGFCLLLFSYCLGTVFSIVFVYLRDLKHALSLILQAWFYATPILYDKTMVPEKYRFILYLNPVGPMFSGMQSSLFDPTSELLTLALASSAWCAFALICLRFTFRGLMKGLVEAI
jgi:ABC-type polysaccharide/polyol phosphate export permease